MNKETEEMQINEMVERDKTQIEEELLKHEKNTGRLSLINGIDLRVMAAIELRIPDSGIDWLDEMIARAEKRDIAAQAMQMRIGLEGWSDEDVAKDAYQIADAMIAERAKE